MLGSTCHCIQTHHSIYLSGVTGLSMEQNWAPAECLDRDKKCCSSQTLRTLNTERQKLMLISKSCPPGQLKKELVESKRLQEQKSCSPTQSLLCFNTHREHVYVIPSLSLEMWHLCIERPAKGGPGNLSKICKMDFLDQKPRSCNSFLSFIQHEEH